MGLFTYTTFVARTKALASQMNTLCSSLATILNGGIEAVNIAADAVGASEHADISSDTTNPYHAGGGIVMPAAGFGTTNLSTQMGLVSTALGMSSGANKGMKYIGYSYHASTPGSCTVTIPANSGASAIIVLARAYIGEGSTQIFTPGLFVINSSTVPSIDFTASNTVKFGTPFGGTAGTDGVVPLNLNTTDLSSSGTRNYEFEISGYISGAGGLTATRFQMIAIAV